MYYLNMIEKLPNSRREHVAPDFGSTAELRKEYEKRDIGADEGTYARAGYRELREREYEIAEIIGVQDTAVFNSGMAAIVTAIEAEGLQAGDVVVRGKEIYKVTEEFIDSLAKRGIRVIQVDSGDVEGIRKVVNQEHPRLIFLETVTNSPEMRVSNVEEISQIVSQAEHIYCKEFTAEALLEKWVLTHESAQHIAADVWMEFLEHLNEYKEGSNPMVFRGAVRALEESLKFSRPEAVREIARIVKYLLKEERHSLTLILDNTLSSPVLRNPLDEVKESDASIVVVESGTKHYQGGDDRITLGVVYSNNQEKLERVKSLRTQMGTYLQSSSEELLPENIEQKMLEKVRLQASHALALATLLEKSPSVNEVIHPNLPSHKDNDLAQELSPHGLVTLFYVKVGDPVGFVDAVKQIAGDTVDLGASFGHEKTRLSPRPHSGTVRISAGAENEEDFNKLVLNFKEALNI